MTRSSLAGFLFLILTTSTLLADDPKMPDVKAYDKLVVDSLAQVHNKAADLYNEHKDFAGAYRMFQGALITVRPLLAHQATAQKMIDDGLAAVEKEPSIAVRAFRLHETIESVRALLKTGGMPVVKPVETKKPAELKPVEPTVTNTPPIKKPMEPIETKKHEEKKPVVIYELAPQPREKK
jgi:hypothetical protein